MLGTVEPHRNVAVNALGFTAVSMPHEESEMWTREGLLCMSNTQVGSTVPKQTPDILGSSGPRRAAPANASQQPPRQC
ncbi:Ribosomal Protein S6 Kinase Alpha-5 [Manis pentadactyla]|nr:Ribosomal Protein S6 Kinase Alpha-5 [Manis pentadactyla]